MKYIQFLTRNPNLQSELTNSFTLRRKIRKTEIRKMISYPLIFLLISFWGGMFINRRCRLLSCTFEGVLFSFRLATGRQPGGFSEKHRDSHYCGGPHRGGTQGTDFTKGFTKGISTDLIKIFIDYIRKCILGNFLWKFL